MAGTTSETKKGSGPPAPVDSTVVRSSPSCRLSCLGDPVGGSDERCGSGGNGAKSADEIVRLRNCFRGEGTGNVESAGAFRLETEPDPALSLRTIPGAFPFALVGSRLTTDPLRARPWRCARFEACRPGASPSTGSSVGSGSGGNSSSETKVSTRRVRSASSRRRCSRSRARWADLLRDAAVAAAPAEVEAEGRTGALPLRGKTVGGDDVEADGEEERERDRGRARTGMGAREGAACDGRTVAADPFEEARLSDRLRRL